MKKYYPIIIAVLIVVSCSEWKNDLVPYTREESNGVQEQSSVLTDDNQLYNMNFDLWSKNGSNDVCYGPNATAAQKNVWASANASTAMFGKLTCVSEDKFLAVQGNGKHAVKLQTHQINALITKKMAAGCMFTGQMGNINLSKLSATLNWGLPFNLKPKALEGYACYKPMTIDVAKAPYDSWLGKTDSAHVYVVLADWDSQFIVDPATDTFLDIDNDPHIIGYGRSGYNHTMDDYEKFTINIEYRNNRTPKYVVIVASSSALGDYFTGGEGSTLYLDELKFIY
jgi:hypothetical protein